MFDAKMLKTYRTTAIAVLGAALVAGCGQAASPLGSSGLATKATVSAKKPGNDTLAAKDAIRAYLESSMPNYQVKVRQLDVVPGPTIQIYPPVKPTIFEFTAKIEAIALDDRLAHLVVSGTYSSVTRTVTVTTRKPVVF